MIKISGDHAVICLKNVEIDKLFLEITSKCNLKCKHCFNSCDKTGEDVEIGVIKEILEKAAEKQIKEIIISGGEPFLNDNLEQIIELCIENNLKIRIITNGSIINESILKRVIQNKYEIQVTLNGSYESIDGKIRGENSFKQTMEFIEKVCSLGGRGYLSVSTCICRGNIDDIENIIELVKDMGLKTHIISFVQKLGRANSNWNELEVSLHEQLMVLDKIAKYEQKNEVNILVSGMYFIKSIFGNTKKNINLEQTKMEEIAIRSNLKIDLSEEINQYRENKVDNVYQDINWESHFFEKEHYIYIKE